MTSAFIPALLSLALCCSCTGHLNVSEKMMWSTYPLVTSKGTGTGFVVTRHDANEPGGIVPVVFTSVHVLETAGKGQLVIGLRLPDETGHVHVLLLVFQPTTRKDGGKFYVRHPRHDLAAFALHLPEEIAGLIPLPSFLDERVLERKGTALHAGDEVTFLGFPNVLPATEGAFPLLRSGRVASYPVGTAQSDGKFLINSDVYPGDSGAPVFISTGTGRPRLVGSITSRLTTEREAFSHLAMAVDADVIRETMVLLAEHENQTAAPPPEK